MRMCPTALAIGMLGVLASCVSTRPWRTDEPPLVAADIADADQVRVLTSGGEFELEEVEWLIDASGGRISGRVIAPAERTGELMEIPVAAVSRAETRRTETLRVLANVGIGIAIAFVVLQGLFAAFVVPPAG